MIFLYSVNRVVFMTYLEIFVYSAFQN